MGSVIPYCICPKQPGALVFIAHISTPKITMNSNVSTAILIVHPGPWCFVPFLHHVNFLFGLWRRCRVDWKLQFPKKNECSNVFDFAGITWKTYEIQRICDDWRGPFYLYIYLYIYIIVIDWITGRRSTWCFPSWSSAPFACPYGNPADLWMLRKKRHTLGTLEYWNSFPRSARGTHS